MYVYISYEVVALLVCVCFFIDCQGMRASVRVYECVRVYVRREPLLCVCCLLPAHPFKTGIEGMGVV